MLVTLTTILTALVGCAPTPTLPPAPLTETALPATAEPVRGPTLPPSWTPGVPATVTRQAIQRETSTPIPPQAVTVEGGSTLAPSWTPFRQPTVTRSPRTAIPTRTPAPPTLTPAVSPTRLLREGPPPVLPSQVFEAEVCNAFSAFAGVNAYAVPDQTVTIGWYLAPSVDLYAVWIRNPQGRFVFRDEVVVKTTEAVTYYDLPGSLFLAPGTFAWEVYPVKAGARLCSSITGQVVVLP